MAQDPSIQLGEAIKTSRPFQFISNFFDTTVKAAIKFFVLISLAERKFDDSSLYSQLKLFVLEDDVFLVITDYTHDPIFEKSPM